MNNLKNLQAQRRRLLATYGSLNRLREVNEAKNTGPNREETLQVVNRRLQAVLDQLKTNALAIVEEQERQDEADAEDLKAEIALERMANQRY